MATSTFGPAEVVALAFPGDHVPQSVQDAVLEAVASGVVTLLDVAVVRRDVDGDVEVLEIEDLGDRLRLTDVELSGAGLAGDEDLAGRHPTTRDRSCAGLPDKEAPPCRSDAASAAPDSSGPPHARP